MIFQVVRVQAMRVQKNIREIPIKEKARKEFIGNFYSRLYVISHPRAITRIRVNSCNSCNSCLFFKIGCNVTLPVRKDRCAPAPALCPHVF
jgi:hypothetical protein